MILKSNMNSIEHLEEIFAHFPGIGPRQAKRFAYFVLSRPKSFIDDLVRTVADVRGKVHECDKCRRIYISDSPSESCGICTDKSRDETTLMIVPRDTDLLNVEASGVFKGLYFVLGGTIPILEKEPDRRIRLKELLNYVGQRNFDEIIISLNATPEGDHTQTIICEAFRNIDTKSRISSLGRGLSTGSEIEYADPETLRSALRGRS